MTRSRDRQPLPRRIAFACALAAAALGIGLLWLYRQRFEVEASGGPKVEILVAKTDLNLGTRLDSEALEVRAIPEAFADRRHVRVSEVKQILGTRVRTQVRAAEAILWTDLATNSPNARDLAGLVMPGMRAYPVPASNLLTFDGLLRPGDRVDVLLTIADPKDGRGKTAPLLQNLIVLAIGRHLGGITSSADSEIDYGTVTLAVEPTQAQILASAMREGVITIALRNTEDIRIITAGGDARVSQR